MSDSHPHNQPDSEQGGATDPTSASLHPRTPHSTAPDAPPLASAAYGPPAAHATPAPYYPAPPARPESAFKRGLGLGAGAGLGLGGMLLVLGLVGSLLSLAMMVGMASAMSGALSGVRQTSVEPLKTVWGPDTAVKKLRAVHISGPIMAESSDGFTLNSGTYGYETAQMLDRLNAEDADGVVLLINTPGGSVNGSRAIADAIARYQRRTGKKAFAYVQGMSASGGMYAMAGASKILADHGSLVGSIGIIAGPFERYKDVTAITGSMLTSGVATSGGITSEYLTQGKGKDFGNPFRDMTPEERANFTTGLAHEYDNFVTWVSTSRGIPAETIKNTYGAYIFDTQTAQQNKLIDGVAGRDEAFRTFATDAGLDPAQTKVVSAQAPGMWAQLFGAQARAYGTSLPAPAVGGQRPLATASLCTGGPVMLAYQGSLNGVCG